MWGVFYSAIMSALAAFAPRLLLMFGFVAFSETVTRDFFTTLMDKAFDSLAGLPSDYRAIVEMTGLPDAISIVFSAYIAAIGISAAKAGFSRRASTFTDPTKGV